MESQQIVDYIRQQLAAGYTEQVLRTHLQKHGWSASAINYAFAQYQASLRPAPSKKSRRRAHIKRVRAGKWTLARWAKLGAAMAVLAAVGFGFQYIQNMRAEQPGPAPKVVLSYPQKQSNDVSLIGGAVAQFAATYGDLPSLVTPMTDGGLAFCGLSCTSSELTLGSPQVYKTTNVKLVGYQSGLTAPDKDTMYLVPAARCASVNKIGDTTTAPRSIVILYAREDGDDLLQRCVTL